MNYQTIELELSNGMATVWLNRPEIRNAFNETMIAEVLDVFTRLNSIPEVRVVLLRGRGKSFCAGADLNWMRDVASYSYEQNLAESLNLSKCFHAIYTCIKPTIAVVHGAAIGGANGLLAACDIAYADDETVFSLSEVKIGIVPACISPYVVKRTGEYGSRELMLTGRRIKGPEAARMGLINKSLHTDALMSYVLETVDLLMSSGPEAVGRCKELLFKVSNVWDMKQAMEETARMIAEIRASSEGQEGMAAFLEKRPANWVRKES
jgi:methylglutaconyl-CoA hydratase